MAREDRRPLFLAGWLLAELHYCSGGIDHQHVVPHGLVVDVDPDHRAGAQLGRLVLHLGQRIADPEAGSFSYDLARPPETLRMPTPTSLNAFTQPRPER
jgi:hypothetical protein